MRTLRLAPTACTLLAAFGLAAGAPALGAEPAKAPPDANAKPPKEAKPKDKPVCRTEEVTGSLMPKRICTNKKQAAQEREAVEDLQRERREAASTSFSDRSMTPSGTLNR